MNSIRLPVILDLICSTGLYFTQIITRKPFLLYVALPKAAKSGREN